MEIRVEWGSKKTFIDIDFLPRVGEIISCSFPEEVSNDIFYLQVKSVSHHVGGSGGVRKLIPSLFLDDHPDPQMQALNQRLWDEGQKR